MRISRATHCCRRLAEKVTSGPHVGNWWALLTAWWTCTSWGIGSARLKASGRAGIWVNAGDGEYVARTCDEG